MKLQKLNMISQTTNLIVWNHYLKGRSSNCPTIYPIFELVFLLATQLYKNELIPEYNKIRNDNQNNTEDDARNNINSDRNIITMNAIFAKVSCMKMNVVAQPYSTDSGIIPI